MPDPDILEQGRRRREHDKLRQHSILNKNTTILAIISIIIAVSALMFSVASHYNWIPKNVSKDTPIAQKESTSETIDTVRTQQ